MFKAEVTYFQSINEIFKPEVTVLSVKLTENILKLEVTYGRYTAALGESVSPVHY